MDATSQLLAVLRPTISAGKGTLTAKETAYLRRLCAPWAKSVTTTGIALGRKEVCGKNVDAACLQVFVSRKLPRTALSTNRLIPQVVRLPGVEEPVLLDVVERRPGRPMTLFRAGDGVARRNDPFSGAGTLGMFVRGKAGGTLYALTCWHVALRSLASDKQMDWCDDPDGRDPNVSFGKVDRSVRPDVGSQQIVRDVALVRVTAPGPWANAPSVDMQAIHGVRQSAVTVGESLSAVGFGSKRRNFGAVTSSKGAQVMTYDSLGAIEFRDCIVCEGFTVTGDSGAVAVDSHGMAVGIVVGGDYTSVRPWTALVPIAPVFDYFKLELPLNSGDGAAPGTRAVLPVGALAEAIDVLARTMWGEAEGEPRVGRIAVANVIINRLLAGRPKQFGATVEEVCQRNNGKVWQFSCWNQAAPRRRVMEKLTTSNDNFRDCLDLAGRAVQRRLEDVTHGATHFYAMSIPTPLWAKGRSPSAVVGRHAFFSDVP